VITLQHFDSLTVSPERQQLAKLFGAEIKCITVPAELFVIK
jgi:hypothetical protein